MRDRIWLFASTMPTINNVPLYVSGAGITNSSPIELLIEFLLNIVACATLTNLNLLTSGVCHPDQHQTFYQSFNWVTIWIIHSQLETLNWASFQFGYLDILWSYGGRKSPRLFLLHSMQFVRQHQVLIIIPLFTILRTSFCTLSWVSLCATNSLLSKSLIDELTANAREESGPPNSHLALVLRLLCYCKHFTFTSQNP